MKTGRGFRSTTDRLIRAFVRMFPLDFRVDHGDDMAQTLRAVHRDARERGDRWSLIALWVEILRDATTTAPREHCAILRQDVTYAWRSLRRAPVFAVSAVLTLALGMSAMTGMMAILNAVMFRPLAVDHPEQLVSISDGAGAWYGLSFPDLQDYRAEKTVLADAIGYDPQIASLNPGTGAERITVEMVTDNYFSMLGLEAAVGRLIRPGEGRGRSDAPVLVLAHAYWQSRFGSDPSIVGRAVRLNGRLFTVVGVAAPAFRGTQSLVRVSAWVPASMFDVFADPPPLRSILDDRAARTFTVLARLAPGVTLAQARAQLEVRAAALARDFPAIHKSIALRVVPETQTRPTPELGAFLRGAATAIAGLAAVLLLITSANVANLLMARAAARGREVALRAALGARRGRIMRQFLTEGVMISMLGAIVPVPIVVVGTGRLRDFIAGVSAMATLEPDFGVDGRVLIAAFVLAAVAGIVAGLAPGLAASRADLGHTLKSGARTLHDSGARFRNLLVSAQVALALALLVSGGLFIRSLDRARHVELGFDPSDLMLASAAPGIQGYAGDKRLDFYRSVRDRIAMIPDVADAAWIQFPPLGIIGEVAEVSPDPRPQNSEWRPPAAAKAIVSPEYFATVRMQLIDGRSFSARDDGTRPRVVIVNETLAQQLWPNQRPIGRRLLEKGIGLEVVGVVRNGKYHNVGEAPLGAVYLPLAQTPPSMASLVVRTTTSAPEIASTLREVIHQVDPDIAVYDVRSMLAHLDNGSAFFPFRLGAFMTSLIGGLGVLLSSIGLYGTVAYHVGQRTQEIGVRMALGAQAADIIRDVLSRGARCAAIGIAVGFVLASALAHLLKGLLLGISPFDPLTHGTVAVLLVTICLLASFVPARRATAVDPLVALREE
jgi:putative ABC transport system permease protein